MLKKLFPAFSTLTLLAFIFSGCAANKAATKERALAFRNLGASLVQEGNVRSGLENLLEAAELDPTDSDTQHELARAYSKLGEYQLSLNHFEKALAQRPKFPQAWNNKGTVHLRLRQWDQAIGCFQKAVEDVLYKTPHFAYNNLGLTYHIKGQYQKAIKSYNKALKFSPAYSPARVNLGLTLERIGRWEDAMDAYKTAISFDSTYPPAHFYLGKLYLNLNKKTEAEQELLETISLDPKGRIAQEAKNLINTMK